MWRQSDPVLQARSLWLLGALGELGRAPVEEALRHSDPRFRILGLRVLRAQSGDVAAELKALLSDPSPQVRREVALALRELPDGAALEPLVALSRQYDGRDRWYLEALGIGARGRENLLYPRLREAFPGWTPLLGELLWEFRPSDALPFLSSHASKGALDALAALPSADAARAVAQLAAGADAALADRAFAHLGRRLFSEWSGFRGDRAVIAAVRKALTDPRRRQAALELAADLGDPAYLPEVEKVAEEGPAPQRALALRAISYARPEGLEPKLRQIIAGQAPNEVRAEAVRILGRSAGGLNFLLDLQEKGELPGEVKNLAAALTNSSRDPQVRARARRLLPPPAARGNAPLPPPGALLAREADAERGRKLFSLTTGPRCNSCHTIGQGKKVGPDLATIGGKLGKQALLDSILNPSAGIAPEYYQWVLETRSQGMVIGILAEDTPERVVVRTENDEEIRLRPSEIVSRRRSRMSMMPDDLVNQMTAQELVDLLAYLTTLK
jgi:putative heme-binding domain-containing protein